MKPTVGELFLTILVIVGLGALGVALHAFAPTFTKTLTDYVTSFFSSNKF